MAIDALEEKGFRGQFIAGGCGDVRCAKCNTVHHAANLHLEDLIRLEGVSDPADMLAVVAVTCPACKTGGTIVLGYGPDASVEDAEILSALEK
jgi:hypothetical protein